MTSSETGESFERSVAASRRWWALMEAEDCLFIVIKAKRALKTAAESLYDCFLENKGMGGCRRGRGARWRQSFFIHTVIM